MPPLVGEETFALAEEHLVANKTHPARRTVQPSAPQGLVHCRDCGYRRYRTSTPSTARKNACDRCPGSDAWRYEGKTKALQADSSR